MTFISFSFVILFSVALLARLTIGRRKTEPTYLGLILFLSVIFYSWEVPAYLLVLLASVLMDYVSGLLIAAQAVYERRRLYLIISLTLNLGLLFLFKYLDFALASLGWLLGVPEQDVPRFNLILPLGISFYTFHSMSYVIDVYRGYITRIKRFDDYLMFVIFFPQLVAGPIATARDFVYQIHRVRRLHWVTFWHGVYLMISGFFLKMVVADNLAPAVDVHWPVAAGPNGDAAMAFCSAALFGGQIFADFAGYTNIARGAAYLLGFRLIINFREPYISQSLQEFWTRWHISLSRWLRNYLYIPLGGNRHGSWQTYRNLMLTMLLGGLWHGAAWTFVVWGLLHGVGLAVERALGLNRPGRSRLVRLGYYLVVQAYILVTWVFFRATSVGEALQLLGNLAVFKTPWAGWGELIIAMSFLLPIVLMHLRAALIQAGLSHPAGKYEKAFLCGIMLYAILTLRGQSDAFLYFQF
ncbi:MAG: alginate O-acetyltransferase [Candidatus Xenobia bacterium]